MLGYACRRLAATAVLLAVVATFALVLVRLAPGDAAITLAGPGATPASVADLRHRLGLDRPFPYQVASYLGSLLRGDLGFSVIQGRPVVDVLASRLPATLLLAGTALAIGAVGGVGLGLVAAYRAHSRLDAAVSLASMVSYSLPGFWVGQLAIQLVAVQLGWLPAGGIRSIGGPGGVAGLLDLARHLLLPALTLSLPLGGLVLRTTRASAISVLAEPYVTAARAVGTPERTLLLRHVARNAIRPVVTVVSYQLGFVITGAVLVEVIFSWPGLGRLLVASVLSRDTPTLVGLLVLLAAAVAVVNLLADLVTAALDPRVRYR